MNIAEFAVLWATVILPTTGEPVNVVLDDRVRMDICVEVVADYIEHDEPFPAMFTLDGKEYFIEIPATDLRCQPTEDI